MTSANREQTELEKRELTEAGEEIQFFMIRFRRGRSEARRFDLTSLLFHSSFDCESALLLSSSRIFQAPPV